MDNREVTTLTATEIFRGFRANIKLGWNMEGNWAPPLVYLCIALVAPIAGVLMLVFMYLVVLGGSSEQSFLAFLLAGSAVYMFVRLILQGSGMSVVEDREHYRILRYIYIAPTPFPAQIAGRVTAKVMVASVGAVVTFAAGWFFFKLPFRPDGVDWGGMFGGLAVGLVGMIALGWVLASMMLLVDRMGWVWAEGIAGLLFLITGMVIPLAILPAPLAWLGRLLPITYWAEVWRHAIYGSVSSLSMPGLELSTIWSRLCVSTLVWLVVAVVWHRVADHLARRWGRIERETFY